MILRFTIAVEPKSKGRHRTTRRGTTYTPKETVNYEREVRVAATDAMRRHAIPQFSGPVVVDITVRLSPPKSISKRLRAAFLSGAEAFTGSKDLDNFMKAILDGMNKVVFDDDRLVVELHGRKIAAETVGVDVVVKAYERDQSQ